MCSQGPLFTGYRRTSVFTLESKARVKRERGVIFTMKHSRTEARDKLGSG